MRTALRTRPIPDLFYDAACRCARSEMDHLRARNHDGRLVFIDIATPASMPAATASVRRRLDAEIHGAAPMARCAASRCCAWPTKPWAWAGCSAHRSLAAVGRWPIGRYRLFARHRRAISRTSAPLIHGLLRWAGPGRRAARMRACASGPHASVLAHQPRHRTSAPPPPRAEGLSHAQRRPHLRRRAGCERGRGPCAPGRR